MRKKISAEIKSQVAIEALKGVKTINEIASIYEVHPNQVSLWKKAVLDSSSEIFSSSKDKRKKREQAEIDGLYCKIGQLEVENEYLKKKWQRIRSQ